MTFAVIPAAGLSTRMGRPKLSMPLGSSTVLEHVVAALHGGGVERVLVVVGPHVPDLATLAERSGAEVCLLSERTPHMRATVEAGLEWIERRHALRDDDGWLLCPADHPCLDADVVRVLIETAARRSDVSIVVPTFEGRRGHPVLLHWRHVAGIRAHRADEGLNAYLRLHGQVTCEIPVPSRGILLDLDTPEDYETIARGHRG